MYNQNVKKINQPDESIAVEPLNIAEAGGIGGRVEDDGLEAGRRAKPSEDETEAEAQQQHIEHFHTLRRHPGPPASTETGENKN